MDKTIILAIVLIILYIISIIPLIPGVIIIQWKNIHIVTLIFYIIIMSYDSICLIISIFILIKKCCLGCLSFLILLLNYFIFIGVHISEIVCFVIFIEKVNYPCKKDETGCPPGKECYYYYYYYRRLISDSKSEYDCDKLGEKYYTGIITKKEETLALVSIILSFIFIIPIFVCWHKMFSERDYESCDCNCDCSCCYSCIKKIKEEKKVEIKVDNQNIQKTDNNDIKMNTDIEIHPTLPNSKEPIQEKNV